MTRMHRATASLFAAFLMLFGCTGVAETIDVRVWQHSITIPDDGIKTLAALRSSLTVAFDDSSLITFSVIDYKDSPYPQSLTPYQFVESVYGEKAPNNPDFQVARKDMLADADAHQIVTVADGIKAYIFKSKNQNIAYVGDRKSERFFMMIDAQNRSLDAIIQSITRR